jgi:ATP-dependent DNA ligase
MATPASAGFIEPMLLLQASRLPEGANWCYELKLDGYRAQAIRTKAGVQLSSRKRNELGGRFPHLAAALSKLPVNTVIDGEIVALDADGRPSFNALQNYRSDASRIVYFAFDVLTLAGKDLAGEPLARRKAALRDRVLSKLADPIGSHRSLMRRSRN